MAACFRVWRRTAPPPTGTDSSSTTTGIGSRAGPADNPRRGRRAASSTTDGQRERPTPAPGPAAEVMQDSGNGLQEGRAEGFYAHGIKFIPNLSTAPL